MFFDRLIFKKNNYICRLFCYFYKIESGLILIFSFLNFFIYIDI